MVVISPFAKPGYIGTKHYSTASVVKTEELLLGLPPNNIGDLFATDLRDLFQSTYNGITADKFQTNLNIAYKPSPEGVKIWSLVKKLDLSGPDRDSSRLGELARLSIAADDLRFSAERAKRLSARSYRVAQRQLFDQAKKLVNGPPIDRD